MDAALAEPEGPARREVYSRIFDLPRWGLLRVPWYAHELDGFGSPFKREIKRRYPTPVSFECQAPSLRSDTNFVDLDPVVKDPYGIPVARMHFQWDENVLKMWEHSKQVCTEVLRAAGGVLEEFGRMSRKFRAGACTKPARAAWGMIRRILLPTASGKPTTCRTYTYATPACF